jgi:hypothetical protein
MGRAEDLELFLSKIIGKDVWFGTCDLIESTSVLVAQKTVGTEYVENTVMKKILEIIDQLDSNQILAFERLLEIDNDTKAMFFDAIQRLKKARQL